MSAAQQTIAVLEKAPKQYLTFTLDGDSFATEITQVREVLEYTQITKVPRTPDFMRGVINLHGSVVPVVDLRLQFGMQATQPTVDTCIVIIEVNLDDQVTVLGALADSVQEVIEINTDQLEDAPSLGTRVDVSFIKAIAKYEETFVIVLDIDQVFSTDQFSLIQQAQQTSQETCTSQDAINSDA